jgi:hypothetical protein
MPSIPEEDQELVIIAIIVIVCSMAVTITHSQYYKILQNTSYQSGAAWLDKVLSGYPDQIINNLGMSKSLFLQLYILLIDKTDIQLHTRHVSSKEQLAIFLYTVVTDLSIRKLAERFQHSLSTIHQYKFYCYICFIIY